jgi:pimeloyl-ACP methyl ester carboxylesterase
MPDGSWEGRSVLTPVCLTTRGLLLMPSNSVVPVIVVPGIMGTNLRAKRHPRTKDERNDVVAPGAPTWRPPNTMPSGLWDAFVWDRVPPDQRQKLLDPDTLEVDDRGPPHIPHGDGRLHIHPQLAGERGWGELHAASYVGLLCALETRLNRTFDCDIVTGERRIMPHWKAVMEVDPQKWGGGRMKALTEADLEKHARHHYPVYAVGYNWLRCCEEASQRLEQRILDIIKSWRDMKRQCDQVILVTHSMGGLVARACAKRIPDQIAGVIHGVMPALGAPAAYRRLACGTEAQGLVGRFAAMILGATTYDTTPVLATSPGALELLPNHLYPRPWLHVAVAQQMATEPQREVVTDYLRLPNEIAPNPYDFYRDMRRWYRLVDPMWADPAGKFSGKKGSVEQAIKNAIDKAERFHKETLGDYYHPNTYAFYGDDPDQRAFGQLRWVAHRKFWERGVLTPANVAEGVFSHTQREGGRVVQIDPECLLHFKPEAPDTPGDGTVPRQSGAGPAHKIEHLFETRGYDHQGAYNNEDMLMLTLRLVVRIVQGMP